MAKAAPKRKAANGYKLAEPLPKGEVLEDVGKKRWLLGPSIGQGGFGEIYSAQDANSTGAKYPYVVKIEPHTNGPLFVEMHFYMRNAKPADIADFKKEKGLKTFGMPLYLGSGSHEYKGEKYRFIVMEKFGTDLWKIFLENDRSFPISTVFKLGVQILDVLEYIHGRGYVHADIKAANILMGTTKETMNKQVFLVDFGLATKFTTETKFKPNPKKAHDGTIEYLSRDAHKGVQTRRGDLEIVAYNLLQWLGCILPWEKNLKNPDIVHKSKEEHMDSVPKMIKSCFNTKTPPGAIVDFLKYINSLNFDSEPDYNKIRKTFASEIKKAGDTLNSPLQLSSKKTPLKRKSGQKGGSSPKRRVGRRRQIEEESEDEKENVEDDEEDKEQELNSDEDIIEASFEEEPELKPRKVKKTKSEENKKEEMVTTKQRGRPKNIVEGNSEDQVPDRVAKKRTKTKGKHASPKKKEPKNQDETTDPYEGYTDAMKEIMMKKVKNGKSKDKKKLKQPDVIEDDMDGYTETMKEIMLKKKERLASKGRLRGKKTE